MGPELPLKPHWDLLSWGEAPLQEGTPPPGRGHRAPFRFPRNLGSWRDCVWGFIQASGGGRGEGCIRPWCTGTPQNLESFQSLRRRRQGRCRAASPEGWPCVLDAALRTRWAQHSRLSSPSGLRPRDGAASGACCCPAGWGDPAGCSGASRGQSRCPGMSGVRCAKRVHGARLSLVHYPLPPFCFGHSVLGRPRVFQEKGKGGGGRKGRGAGRRLWDSWAGARRSIKLSLHAALSQSHGPSSSSTAGPGRAQSRCR